MEAVELEPTERAVEETQGRTEETVPAAVTQTQLLVDDRYVSQTCGQAPELVARLRAAQVAHDGGDPEALRSLCDELLDALPCSGSAAILVAPPMGKPNCVAVRGDAPYAVAVWLLLDPLDIDSKQTTFVLRNATPSALAPCASVAAVFEKLYKLKPEPQ
eukprot:COSAG02_NODE_13314_length_1411_cov_1.271341_2_plen_160_part_00